MAILHPTDYKPVSPGEYKEVEILNYLKSGLDHSYDVFHSVLINVVDNDESHFRECDIVIVTPGGHLAILEVKAGEVEANEHGLIKRYSNGSKDITSQVKAQFNNWRDRLQKHDLSKVKIESFLVIPDCHVTKETAVFPRERIIDASQIDKLCSIIMHNTKHKALPYEQRTKIIRFIENKFHLVPDVSTVVGLLERRTKVLSEGLAMWVPKISHKDNRYLIQATAGSGKTQLSIRLIQNTTLNNQLSLYVCFNRALADHIQTLINKEYATAQTFHQLCIDSYRNNRSKIDFTDQDTFTLAFYSFLETAPQFLSKYGCIIIDEYQDFETEWIDSLLNNCKKDTLCYILGDRDQHINKNKIISDFPAVNITCHDNFRSPIAIVNTINTLQLTPTPILSRSLYKGNDPIIQVTNSPAETCAKIETTIESLLKNKFTPEQIAIVTFHGRERSHLLKLDCIGQFQLAKFTGNYDQSSQAIWTKGDITIDTVYRFKGQAAPVILFAEIDFNEFDDLVRRKLFVGMTRAKHSLYLFISQKTSQLFSQYFSRNL
ncbi:MAG: AAA family ATPase [Methylacidiphilales bacterium]|nr:AAA family ATPase [Candidatus Methylacidiphilales bacterium]